MDDLISRQAARRIIEDINTFVSGWRYSALEQIDNLPAIEIVHCEECIYYENKNTGLCDLGGSWDPYDYCSNGRRYKHG